MNELIKEKLAELISLCESEGEPAMAGNLSVIRGAHIAGFAYEAILTSAITECIHTVLMPKLASEQKDINQQIASILN